jgi:hypothetical protein
MVLLSRQRGTKGLLVSVKDEFSALAIDVLVTRSPVSVVNTVVALLHTTLQLLDTGWLHEQQGQSQCRGRDAHREAQRLSAEFGVAEQTSQQRSVSTCCLRFSKDAH